MGFAAAVPVLGAALDSLMKGADSLFTSDEERLKFRALMLETTAPAVMAVVQAHIAGLELQAKLAQVEAASEDRFVRWRRPILSLVSTANFLVMSWLGALGYPIPDLQYAFVLAALASGLDIGTRGLEKMVGKWSNGRNGGVR